VNGDLPVDEVTELIRLVIEGHRAARADSF
jgi:hypothetical protein